MAYPMKQSLLTASKWARPRTRLKGVDAIVWHWVANPNSTAIANRNFFNNRTGSYGSAHYIIGLHGEQIQCLPDNEMAYHVGSHVYTLRSLQELGSYPNNNTVGIECTHIDWNGKMTRQTYESLIDLTVILLKRHNLTVDDIWLHQEVVGWKDCHRLFVNNKTEYRKAKEEVAKRMKQTIKRPPAVINPKEETDMVRTDDNGRYTIQKGDTLWAIAHAFDTTVASLEKLNPSVKAASLQIGSKIKITNNPTPTTPTKNGIQWVGTNDKGKRIEAIVSTVNYYDTQRWTNPTGTFKKGAGWIVDNLYRVNGSLQYRVQNSDGDLYYITARQDLVRIVDKANLTVDGYMGTLTIKALQQYFNTPVDGVISKPSLMVKELQKLIGVKQDGYLGQITIRAMQKRFGTPQDGIISKPSMMVRELQRRLNAGKL